MTFKTPVEAINYINSSRQLNFEDSFDLSVYCSKLLRSKENESQAREIVIRIRDKWEFIPDATKPIWNDLTESSGLYPYLLPALLSQSGLLRYEYHKSRFLSNVYFHEEQQALSIELQSDKAVVVSAPTSFGKSLLIEEIIASEKYQNVVIIQPTLALLDETRKKMLKYKNEYKIIVSTDQLPEKENKNIFLFTGERVVEYPHFPAVDFFVIDEFYKLSIQREDDRAIALNQAFHKLLRFTSKFYMLGPMIKSIPLSFQERFELTWFPTNFATVAVDEKSLEISSRLKPKERKVEKKRLLFQYLADNPEQTLIYCSSPNKATKLAIECLTQISNANVDNISFNNGAMIEWISQNINEKWSLIEALKYGVGFHHGALPRHLGSAIVDAFNEGNIRYLFCTSTLIEGVNTSAKTVILYDKEKGTVPIDFFDYKNIAGRSGRMNKHFIGNVIRFEKPPEQMDLFVDIPLFDQKNAPLEILIGLSNDEIDEDAKYKVQEFNDLSENLKDVLRRNSGINIAGQREMIKEIEKNISGYHRLLNWNGFPTYVQLLSVINLAWDHLIKPGENKADVRSAAQLAVLTIRYSSLKSITAVISATIDDNYWKAEIPDEQERIDRLTFFILNVNRHWFDYKLPKWISVVYEIQNYVFTEAGRQPGNYSFFATNLENGFLPKNMASLMEYDIPFSAVQKLQNILQTSNTTEQNISSVNRLPHSQLRRMGLIEYEINKIRNAF
jgi:hypothetical protein